MQARMERRGAEARVPLDLFVRLSHEDFDEPFDADGVDVGRGGLALRSDFLPEVGDRLSCRFETPLSTDPLEVDGEVVWAHDAGERSGQFGLRFRDLDASREHDLFRLVEHLSSEEEKRGTRLHLDGVGSPIEGRVVASSEAWIRVEQELPFLQLGMSVSLESDGASPRGTLSSVDLRIEEGTPRLILGVSYESARSSTLDEHDVSTVEGLSARAPATRDDASLDGRPAPAEESTLMDYELPAVLREDDAALGERLDEEVAALLDDATGSDGLEGSEPLDEGAFQVERFAAAPEEAAPRIVRVRESAQVFALDGDDEDDDDDMAEREALARALVGDMDLDGEADLDGDADGEQGFADGERDDASLDGASEAAPGASLSEKARAMLGVAWAATRAFWLTHALPFLGKVWGLLATFSAAVIARGGPGAKKVAGRIGAVGAGLFAKVGGRFAKVGKKRRTTAPVPRRVAGAPRRRKAAVEVEEVAPKKRGRIVLLSVVAFAGVAGGVYALTRPDAPPPVPEAPAPTYAAAPPPPVYAPAPVAAPVIAPVAAPLEAASAETIDPEAGEVLPAVAEEPAPPAGGRLDEPSYPTLRDATDRPAGPVSEGRRFGADTVPNGRSATIRMSEPVTTLEGQATEDGFSVTIPGSLARDRAGPIAAANPAVDRATILNRGDHSVLTITFVAGRTPAYQVVARDRAIEVVIER